MTIHRLLKLSGAIIASLIALIVGSCSKPSLPDNLEPLIEIYPAEDITRTSAVISAHIEKRGSTPLNYITFHYGETGNIDKERDADNPQAENVSLVMEDLKPGTEYSCYVECGTATASLKSEIINFTTIPNELPSISSLNVLSSGPVGLIVSFEILDDGGEPVLNAGCELTNVSTQEVTRFFLPADNLEEGLHRLNIGGLNMSTRYILAPFASNTIGEVMGSALEFMTKNSIEIEQPGSLEALFAGSTILRLTNLPITGEMNGDDFRFLRYLIGAPDKEGRYSIESHVTSVDLTDAVIVEGGGPYDGSRYTVADEVSTDLFADCLKLKDISLPSSATKLARDAFARCSSLEILTIPANIESLLPSSGCEALKEIKVSAANRNYTSIDGVLFNNDATEILWFPEGKTGSYSLPPSITGIGENAFSGTKITKLEIPSTVTVISRGAFSGSMLSEIILPDNITNIFEGMFQNCASLITVHLGSGTEFIGNYVFDGTNLENLYVAATIPPFTSADSFINRNKPMFDNCKLYVPKGCKAMYRNHSKWGQFINIEEFSEN